VTGPRRRENWLKKLGVAGLRPNVGAVLALLDGDIDKVEGQQFCPGAVARLLAERSKAARGGDAFSVACVFAQREFESWLIAGIDSLAGRSLPDGAPGIRAGVTSDHINPELAPRDAKEWLRQHIPGGYKPTTHLKSLTDLLVKDLSVIRSRNLRSFVQFEKAIGELAAAVRTGKPITSPRGK
jgi:hypothetical protein